ncbi:MAG: anaerobic ribonucleoside-triphosphate reductase [Nitrososphaeraceae archaeon]
MSHEFSFQTESRRGGVLESATKRVRMIFSVMASPNRIDILRILNSKGPLTYSELKSLAGFKSKKESGKFAYHLRKLLRQSLVALNKSERRYTITNLGKLVLSLARQIEERSIVESGKMYVRTSRHSIEEFNAHKIVQSLVREANMPLEQAHKITEEVENKIYKFQTAYLTSSLIRETVNSVLVEHGYEDYRNKLARVGLPTSDIVDMLASVDKLKNGMDSIFSKVSHSLFSEHLLNNVLPKDLADMHLAGELNISHCGIWGLMPDSIFLNVNDLCANGLNFKGKYLNVSRFENLRRSDDLVSTLSILISLLNREASTEIVLEGVPHKMLELSDSLGNVASLFSKMLMNASSSPSYSISGLPLTTIILPIDELEDKFIDDLLVGYSKYVECTPIPRIGLELIYNPNSHKFGIHSERVASNIRLGGVISISKDGTRSNNGVRKSIGDKVSNTVITLQSLSINLPRIAYQSNKDETYFRARLAMLIKPALMALSIRKKIITDLILKGTLPIVASSAKYMEVGIANIIINLAGAREAVYDILGHNATNNGPEILHKVIKTSVDVAMDQGKQLGEDTIGVAMINDHGTSRFAPLDSDKYGRSLILAPKKEYDMYSQGMLLDSAKILQGEDTIRAIEEFNAIDRLLNGGLSVDIDFSNSTSISDTKKTLEIASNLNYMRPNLKIKICNTCGKKSTALNSANCPFCNSPSIFQAQSVSL